MQRCIAGLQAERPLVGRGSLLVPAERDIGAAQQGPALDLAAGLLEPLAQLLDELHHVHLRAAVLGRLALGGALGERLARQARRADREIEQQCAERHPDRDRAGDQAGRRFLAGLSGDGGLPAGVGGEHAATDLGPRRLGLDLADRTSRLLAVELGELVAIDRKVVFGGVRRRRTAAVERPQQRSGDGRGHQGDDDPEDHMSPSSRSRARRRSSSALRGAATASPPAMARRRLRRNSATPSVPMRNSAKGPNHST